jgi:hypothetical protein
MNAIRIFLSLVLLLFAASCEKEENNTKLSLDKIGGYVQKGPFLNGTSVTISELSGDLSPTGLNFSSRILDNKGTFEIRDVELNINLLSDTTASKTNIYVYENGDTEATWQKEINVR